LKSIDISQNENLDVEKAFQTFKELPNLEILNLSGIDNLSVLPKEINKITNLKSIRLDYLRDKFDYKASFDRLSSLNINSLSLTNNWLNTLPQTITRLKELEYIDLSDNDFELLPTE
jgi:Leucine-rich repeat (LRR) protein